MSKQSLVEYARATCEWDTHYIPVPDECGSLRCSCGQGHLRLGYARAVIEAILPHLSEESRARLEEEVGR